MLAVHPSDAISLFWHPVNGHLVRPHIRIHRRPSPPKSTPTYLGYRWPTDCPTVTMTHISPRFRDLRASHCTRIHRISCPKSLSLHRSWPTPTVCRSTTRRHFEWYVCGRPIKWFLWSTCCCCPVTKCGWFCLRHTWNSNNVASKWEAEVIVMQISVSVVRDIESD